MVKLSNRLLEAALRYAREYGWKVFPLDGKRPFPGSHGHKDATTDEAQIRAWWQKNPNANVGVACSSRTGPLVLDIDGTEGFAALLDFIGGKEDKLSAHRVVLSGKKGMHLYFSPNGRSVRRKIKIAGELDVLGDGGYVVAPPSIHPETGKEYAWATDWLSTEMGPFPSFLFDASQASESELTIGNQHRDRVTEGSRDDYLTSRAGSMRARGWSERAVLAALREENEEKCDPPLTERQLRKIARSIGSKPPGMPLEQRLEQINEHYAVVQIGSSVQIMQERDGEMVLLARRDFELLFSNQSVQVTDADGKQKEAKLARRWLEWPGRREYERLVFRPGRPAGPGEYNLWRGWGVERNPDGTCTRFLDHLRRIVCSGNDQHYEWLLDWLAQMFQQPERKSGLAIAMRGSQGAGKSMVGAVLKRLLGPYQIIAEKPDQVTGRFNAHLGECLLLQAEEAFWAGDKKGQGVLKHLVTSDRLIIERKGVDAEEIDNYTRLLITSNSSWVWPADLDDRRLVIFDVKSVRRGDHDYFRSIFRQLEEEGGYGKLLDLLLTREIDEHRLRSEPPRTKALEDQVIHSMEPHEAWLYGLLKSAVLPGPVDILDDGSARIVTRALYDDYTLTLSPHQRRESEQAFGLFIKKHLGRVKGTATRRVHYTTALGRKTSMTSRSQVIPPLEEIRRRYSEIGRAAPRAWGKPSVWRPQETPYSMV
jgi:hypothetical protein